MNIPFTILVADDKEDVVNAVAQDLNLLAHKYNKNIRILKALTGLEVIQLAEKENIDAFYIDYMFEQGINGDEIIQNIQDPFQTNFFVLMSGWKEDILENVINKNHRRLKGRCRFLRKPYDALTFQSCFLDMFSFFEALSYPLPIQYVYEAYLSSPEGIQRALALRDFYETLIKFSVSILMADLLRQEDHLDFRVKFKPDLNMTYGAWLTWLTLLLKFFQNRSGSAFLPEIIEFYEANSLNPLEIIGQFKNIRDNELGHGYAKDNELYTLLTSDHEKSIDSLYQNLIFLSRYTLIFPEKATFSTDESEGYKYQVRRLMGSEMIQSTVELSSTLRLHLSRVYLYSHTNEIISLSPFIDYKFCPDCRVKRFYFLDRLQGPHMVYNSFCNHRMNDKEAKTHFDKSYRYIFNNGNI
jgi:CheY-like chemotaxis protein